MPATFGSAIIATNDGPRSPLPGEGSAVTLGSHAAAPATLPKSIDVENVMKADSNLAAPAAGLTPETNGKFAISKGAACVAFFAAGISFTLIALLHALAPQYDPSWRFVSEYAVGPFGWMMQLAFAAMAASFGSLAIALRGEVASQLGKVGIFMLFTATAGCAIAGMFSIDPISPAPAQPSLSGSLHGLGSMIGIPALPIAALLVTYSLTQLQDWQSSRLRLRLLANSTWISLVAMFVLMATWLSANHGQFGPEVPLGWLNRIVIITYLAWTMLTAAAAAGIAQGRLSQAGE